MADAALAAMQAEVTALRAALDAEQQARVALEATVAGAGGGGAATTVTKRRIGIDTRNLGRPDSFDGTDGRWRDWSIVFRSYSLLVNPLLGQLMEQAERLDVPALATTLASDAHKEAAGELYHLLLHLTKGAALDRVVNAGQAEGLEAWRSLVQRFDPRLRSRAAGQLLELLKWDFSGDTLQRLEAFERALRDYQAAATETVSDSLRIGIVLNRVTDQELAAHLLYNSERLATWVAFRAEIINISKAKAAAAGAFSIAAGSSGYSGAAPMDVGAVDQRGGKKGGGKGFGSPQTRLCYNCGKPGHVSRECRSPPNPNAGRKGEPKGGGRGGQHTGDGGKGDRRKCFKCGRPGHISKDCRSKAVHGVDEEQRANPAAPATPTPTQPLREPEEAPGDGHKSLDGITHEGLWLTGIEYDRDEIQHIGGLDEHGREKIRFGVDSGAALTVVKKTAAVSYPTTTRPGVKKMRDCSGNIVPDLGEKVLGLRGHGGLRYSRVTTAPVSKNLMAVCDLLKNRHEVVFHPSGSYIRHLDTGNKIYMVEDGGTFDIEFALEPYRAVGAPPRG